MINKGLCRTEINKRIKRVKRIFKSAASEELVAPAVFEGLRTVDGLRYGRTAAKESEPINPVSEHHFHLTFPFVSPQIAAMIRLQMLTGMRPMEVASMRLADIDRSGEVWVYEPEAHKYKWRGHRRLIPLGPKSQEILRPFLARKERAYLFSPAEAETWRNEQRAQKRNRSTPVYPCELRTREKRIQQSKGKQRLKPFGLLYSADSYRRAIEYGVKKANRERLKGDPKAEHIPNWTPYQLRHYFATEMRRLHGVEAAQLGLGHARTNLVDVDAEKNLDLLVSMARQVG